MSDMPTLDQLDSETRTLLALVKLDRKDPLFSTGAEVAEEVELSMQTARKYLKALTSRGYVETSKGIRPPWMYRCTAKGAARANQLHLLKPRQRLIYATLRRIGEGDYKAIAKAADLDPNGVSQSLPAMADRKLIKPVYNTGRRGWVYAA